MTNVAPSRSLVRSEILWEYTRSLCPTCKQVIDAQVYLRDDKVYLRKRCKEHGSFEALIFGDARLYVDIARFNKPGTLPPHFSTQVREGCPYDCGLCTDHQQHACLGVIEVNNICNLDCPVCFANAGTQLKRDQTSFELTYAQVNAMLDTFITCEGSPEVLQFSGGEPSLHPQILDFIALAQQKGIRYVMLNTNGIRIAHDDRFLEGLARLKPHIYLQFDGFEPETNRLLRGRSDLLDDKLRALERMAQADVRVDGIGPHTSVFLRDHQSQEALFHSFFPQPLGIFPLHIALSAVFPPGFLLHKVLEHLTPHFLFFSKFKIHD